MSNLAELNELTKQIIGAAIEVHRHLGLLNFNVKLLKDGIRRFIM